MNMVEFCCGVVGETESQTPIEPTSRRRSRDVLPFKYIADVAPSQPDSSRKRPKLDLSDCQNAVENRKPVNDEDKQAKEEGDSNVNDNVVSGTEVIEQLPPPKFGITSVCGRRRDMEDSVSVHPFFSQQEFHYFAVFDGHGCSHVATMCKERLHQILNEEIREAREKNMELEWKKVMEKGFGLMDDEVQKRSHSDNQSLRCRCELQTPHCDAVGSTAVVVVVTPEKIIVSNCGDSRAVLCRKGVAIPLSSDHKPDRPDEMNRVESAGGRVINWDVPRVLGVLSMSRAIGDNYLKPYVISEPEVTVTKRSNDDECLILASDGLWDVVSNETACGVVRMCLKAERPPLPPGSPGTVDGSDRACSDASILLTKLALARHSSDNVSVVVVDLKRDRQFSCRNVTNNNNNNVN
ncbi:unnamed protein product [Lupinus luteus]|uniref:protein-serine/threonine phosphatase n=1 Tax=Lupinus luteus TaxID=3873 RepID=A0AAV1YLC1_LUPLU